MSGVETSRRSQKKAGAPTGRNYPLNCWWVAATADEVTRTPLGRWLLDMPVVLFRTEAGAPVALDNRCVHRWAPLSEGYLEGDLIVCPYHGARYATDGRCTRFPTQDGVPKSAQVRSYALMERGPYIWIWMGDDDKRRAAEPPPDFPFATDPNWTVMRGGFLLEANYMLLHENVLDLTHFNYLHRDSFQILNRRPPNYRVEGDQVHFHETYEAAGMSPSEREAMQLNGPFDIKHETTAAFLTPALHMATGTTYRAPNDTAPQKSLRHVVHMLTPESPTRSHYWWMNGVDRPLPAEVAQAVRARIEMAFGEDKVMLAAIQNTIDRDPRGRNFMELHFNGDTGGVQARLALQRILAADAAG